MMTFSRPRLLISNWPRPERVTNGSSPPPEAAGSRIQAGDTPSAVPSPNRVRTVGDVSPRSICDSVPIDRPVFSERVLADQRRVIGRGVDQSGPLPQHAQRAQPGEEPGVDGGRLRQHGKIGAQAHPWAFGHLRAADHLATAGLVHVAEAVDQRDGGADERAHRLECHRLDAHAEAGKRHSRQSGHLRIVAAGGHHHAVRRDAMLTHRDRSDPPAAALDAGDRRAVDDDTAHHCRLHGTGQRRRSHAWGERRPRAAQQAQYRHGVSGLSALSAYERRRECRLPVAGAWLRSPDGGQQGGGDAGGRRPCRLRPALHPADVGRPESARGSGTGPRLRAGTGAARRADGGPRQEAARQHADGNPAHRQTIGRDRHFGHARSGRSPCHERPHRPVRERPSCADRHPAGIVRKAVDLLRRRLHRRSQYSQRHRRRGWHPHGGRLALYGAGAPARAAGSARRIAIRATPTPSTRCPQDPNRSRRLCQASCAQTC